MRPLLVIVMALGPGVLSACPNPAGTPTPRRGPPLPEGDLPETASARRLERLLYEEARGRLARAKRPALAAALRRRAAEWEALRAPAAALADLDHAAALHPAWPGPAWRVLEARVARALGDRALGRGEPSLARRQYRRAARAGAEPLAAWRQAALNPRAASLGDLGLAVERLHRMGPERTARLFDIYLERGGEAPEVLLSGMGAVMELPDVSLARRALDAILGRGEGSHRLRACALVGRDAGDPRCSGAPGEARVPDPGASHLPGAPLPLALGRARGAARIHVERAHRVLGELLHRWGLEVPSPGAPWPEPLPDRSSVDRSWALVASGAREAARAADPLYHAVLDAISGRPDSAKMHARRADPGSGLRLLARLQALGGQRRAAALTLLHLRERSPGGVTWLLPCLEDLGVLGLAEAARSLATPLVESMPKDPEVLRVLVGLFVAIGEADRAVLMAERWASLDPDPAVAYRFAMRRFAYSGDARRVARFARQLLEWTGGVPGPTQRAVSRALRLVGRHTEARLVGRPLDGRYAKTRVAASAPRPAPPIGVRVEAPAPRRATTPASTCDVALITTRSHRGISEADLLRFAVCVVKAPPRRAAALAYLAAALVARAGQDARARRVFADAWQRDPERFGAAGLRRLGLATRARPLSALLHWGSIRLERTTPCLR